MKRLYLGVIRPECSEMLKLAIFKYGLKLMEFSRKFVLFKVIRLKFNLFSGEKHENCLPCHVKVLLILVKFGSQKLTLITLTFLGGELPLQQEKIKTSFYQNQNL
jgi:hypothetical protein